MTETERILSLTTPERLPELPDLARHHGAPPLRTAQTHVLRQWRHALEAPEGGWGARGVAALLGCGHGKTLIGLLLGPMARAITGRALRVVHLVPASLRDQLRADHAAWSRHYHLDPLDPGDVLSHEGLSSRGGKYALRQLAPDVLVIDEAHRFADPDSGRWRRVAEYLRIRPDARVVVMSGSITWRGLRQCRHLLLAALRDWCPLPSTRLLDHWAPTIDVGAEPDEVCLQAIAPLCEWAGGLPPRAAYLARLRSCPGVTLTADVGTSVALTCTAWRPTVAPPPTVAAAWEGLERRWELPDGTQLLSALDQHRHARTLALGCYQRWDPDTVDPEWYTARAAWLREVRGLVEYVGHIYQTPADVVADAIAGRLDARRMAVYREWESVADREPPATETVWLDGADAYVARIVGGWTGAWHGEDRPPAVIWTHTPEIGERVAGILGVRYHGAGSEPPTGGLAVASIRVHGTGWAGAPRAGYTRALVLEPPSSAATWEQLLARLHRPGAPDDVEVTVLCSTAHGYRAIASGVEGARYIRETTGMAQRMLDASWVGYTINRVDG